DTWILARRHRSLQGGSDGGEFLLLLRGRQRLDLLLHHLGGLHYAFHHRSGKNAAEHTAIADTRIILEPDRMRGTAPRHGDRRLVLAGHDDVGTCSNVPFDKFVLLKVVPVRLQDGEDRLGRGVGWETLPEYEDIERIEA